MNGEAFEPALVSIVITNYNYERFLSEAIDGALSQTYSNVEVVVVDDGSTDNSRDVIESYGKQVVPILKDNGGQSSACNVGFSASKGSIVIFFDADDVLLPETVERVVAAFEAHPGAAKVQYRMQVVDAHSKPTGELRPPSHVRGLNGDLRRHILKYHWYFWPSTSGNAFASAVVRQLLPIPEDLYRGNPDIYLCNVSPLFGEVVSLDEVGVLYRVHGNSSYSSFLGGMNVAGVRKTLLAIADSHAKQRHFLNVLYSTDVQELGSRDLYFLSERVISLKIDPQSHPFKDSLLRLCARGCILSAFMPDPGRRTHARLLWSLWFAAMFLSPRTLAVTLADMFYKRERRGRLYDGLMSLLYGKS